MRASANTLSSKFKGTLSRDSNIFPIHWVSANPPDSGYLPILPLPANDLFAILFLVPAGYFYNKYCIGKGPLKITYDQSAF